VVLAEQRSAREKSLRAASRTLAELLDRDEAAGALLGDDSLPAASSYLDICRSAYGAGGAAELRLEKRRRLLQIAAFDRAGDLQLEEVGGALAHLADACLQTVLETLDAPGLCVVAMGKLGARELNYVSDIDVMFVTGDDPGPSMVAAEQLLEILGGHSPEGRAFEIDTALRPEGRAGALVRSLEGCLEYYKRWAKEWEYQALLKARPCAGSLAVGGELVEETRPLVFLEEVASERIAAIRKMKQLVEEHAARGASAPRSPGRSPSSPRPRGRTRRRAEDVKLSPGGIRDIEFSVQLLQLVHGGGDPSVRAPATLDALGVLVEGGYMAEEDGAGLDVAYRWLRTVEHRLQLRQERRVRTLPTAEEERGRLARVMGFRDSPGESAAARFEAMHAGVLADVRNRFEKLFYRPMVESLAGEARLGAEPLRDRLRILGFRDVERAARTLEELVSGTSRRAKLFRVLTPALLRHLSDASRPDDGLFGFLKLGEALSDRLDALGALRDNPPGIEFLARVLGSGRFLGEVLEHVPEELTTIADPRGPQPPKERERLMREAEASLDWRDPEGRLDGLRRFKRREMLRVALYDLAGGSDIERVGAGLADLADGCLQAAVPDDVKFAVIGMGKLGGR
jgi:[glutamine synthetase] adenylyltransferase / [glutamine synthetase]-adenylyl-L-tyrosine phosphorylase